MKGLNLAEYTLKQHIKHRGSHTALILVDDIAVQRQVTYKQLYHDVCCVMTGLQGLGLVKGSVVCIQAEDVYDLLLPGYAVD